jgi:hypothetical protein
LKSTTHSKFSAPTFASPLDFHIEIASRSRNYERFTKDFLGVLGVSAVKWSSIII